MKHKSILFAVVILVFAACAQNTNTLLSGKVDVESVDEVRVKLADIDTVLTVADGAFSIELPRDVVNIGYVQTIFGSYDFISDGSKISIDFTADPVERVSSSKSVCAEYFSFQAAVRAFVKDYMASAEEIENDETLSEEEKEAKANEVYDNAIEVFLVDAKNVIKNNSDNAVAAVVLQNIVNMVEPAELLTIVDGLSDEIKEQSYIASLMVSIKAQAETAEGKMFTDFEVETVPGKIEKLSDYVGNGKYMLVDFWASWCGPCKGEIPNLKNVYERFHGEDFDILSVAVWDEPQASVDTAAAYNIPWNHMINAQKIPTDIYGINGIPHIILFGPDGTIIKRDLRSEEIAETVGQYVK